MDAKLKKVIEFIQKNGVSREEDWQNNISLVEPDWQKVMTCPDNWKELEGVCRCSEYIYLARYEGGYKEGPIYLHEIISDLKPEEWNFHSKKMKEYLINETFDRWPGEPFETMKRSYHREGIGAAGIMIPFFGYMPSLQVIQMKKIVEEAGDEESLKLINDFIKERERICQPPKTMMAVDQTIGYNPCPFERELISDLLWMFKKENFAIIPLPPIFLSYETPPLFLLYPHLSPDFEEARHRDREERHSNIRNNEWDSNIRNHGYPETYGIEELLGCYSPNPGIKLYVLGIRWLSEKRNFDQNFLRSVVLVHEISHWIMHMLPGPGAPKWDTELYNLTETELHETWAQLLTSWVSGHCGSGSEFAQTFDKLSACQPAKYNFYKKFVKINSSTIINSLVVMRKLKTPATLKDFETFIG